MHTKAKVKSARSRFPGRRRVRCFLIGSALTAISIAPLHAEEQDAIKTDRPDFVESASVVKKGQFQVETGIAIERDTTQGNYQRTFTTPTLLRIGVHDALELRVETDGRTVRRTEDSATGGASTVRGYSDLSLGMKWHMQDGEGMKPELGLLLHADLDSGSSAFRGNGVRPSLRLAAEWELPNQYSLGVMPGFIYDKRADGERFFGGIFAVSLQKSLNDRLSAFVELAAPQIARAKNGGSIVSYDVGMAYLLTPSWQIDTAIQIGANRNTPDRSGTIGISTRF
ncbi:MAG: transporter [Herminiimonas sp.]|nr:transporter [Herminiimonas sp.]